MKASWKVPSSLTNKKSNSRATKVSELWLLEMYETVTPSKSAGPVKVLVLGECQKAAHSISTKSGSVNLDSVSARLTGQSKAKKLTRSSFYPAGKYLLKSVSIVVSAVNDRGTSDNVASATKNFKVPDKPTMTALAQNEATGRVSCTITAAKDSGAKERYDTQYVVTVVNTRTGKTATTDKSFTGSSYTYSYDVADRDQLTDTQYVKVTVKARSRGYAGASAWVTKSVVVGAAAQPTITAVQVPSMDPTAKVTVLLDTNATKEHPVDGIRLQKLVSVDYEDAGEIPGNTVWDDVGSQDNGKCTALSLRVADLIPARGKKTWIRLKAWNDFENRPSFVQYSKAWRVTQLETPAPTAQDDEIVFLSLEPGSDGQSAIAMLGWNADGADDSTSTELSWSDAEDAWRSTDQPKTFDFEWSDGQLSYGGKTYGDSAKVVIKGLEEGMPVYARSRRHMKTDEVDEFGKYSDTLVAMPVTSPLSVVLTAPDYVPEGSGATFTWSFDSTSVQRTWRLMRQVGNSQADGDEVIAEGESPLGTCHVDWERLEGLLDGGDVLRSYLAMSTGGAEVVSKTVTTRVVLPPTVEVAAVGDLTRQPAAFTVRSNIGYADVSLVVSALNIEGAWPDGDRMQSEGDTVWSDLISPAWEYNNSYGLYEATVELPDGLDFWDLSKYEVTVRAIDPTSGLSSEEDTVDFDVSWAHQAPTPSDDIAVLPFDSTDEDGARTIGAVIRLAAPEGAAETDVYDVYRMSADGPELVASGCALDAEVTDRFAPYGSAELAYRIACRTADGDVDWLDFGYSLLPVGPTDGSMVRVDWDGKYVELGHCVTASPVFTKDFAEHKHLDGSVSGSWNRAVSHVETLTASLIRGVEATQASLLRELAQYAGAVFVRTSDGVAFEGDVQVSGPNTLFGTASAPVQLTATRTNLGRQFMADVPGGEGEDEEAEG